MSRLRAAGCVLRCLRGFFTLAIEADDGVSSMIVPANAVSSTGTRGGGAGVCASTLALFPVRGTSGLTYTLPGNDAGGLNKAGRQSRTYGPDVITGRGAM